MSRKSCEHTVNLSLADASDACAGDEFLGLLMRWLNWLGLRLYRTM